MKHLPVDINRFIDHEKVNINVGGLVNGYFFVLDFPLALDPSFHPHEYKISDGRFNSTTTVVLTR